MKMLGVIAIVAMLFSGCAQFQRSEVIDTDKLGGFASGEYRENSSGSNGRVVLGGSGAGWGIHGGGLGVGWIDIQTGPPPSGAYNFARSIAMINYSKRLKSVTYDQFGGVIDYEFDQTSLAPKQYSSPVKASRLPSSFGYQPVE
jgi:hypothetical protein